MLNPPLEGKLNPASVRNHLHSLAQKVEDELGEEEFMYADGCENEWRELPQPDLPITVGIALLCHFPKYKL